MSGVMFKNVISCIEAGIPYELRSRLGVSVIPLRFLIISKATGL